jgi:NCS1 family nucleobase:cation symporter-1
VEKVDSNLRNPELLPTKDKDRDISIGDFTMLWAGMTINMGAFTMGAQLYPDLSPVTILIAILVAYLMVTSILILTGDIGLVYGLPFAVYIRKCFGYKGANIPAFFRAIPACFWFGFQTWVGAVALDMIMEMWIGYSNVTLLILLFGTLQILNAVFGMKAMAKFDWIAIPSLVILIAAVTFWLLKMNDATIIDVFAAPSSGTGSFWFAVMGIAGIWITMGINSPDLNRKLKRSVDHSSDNFFIRNRKPIYAQLTGLVIIGAGTLLVGMIGGILTGTWDPVEIIANSITTPVILLLSLLTIVFAQWSTNTAANLMPAAYVIMNAFPKLNFAKGVVAAGIIGLLMMPWVFADNLLWFTVITSGLLGPIAGIMITDYHILRKRKLDIEEFYTTDGQTSFNKKGFIAYGISFVLSILFMDYAFFIGFVVSTLLYYVLMKNEVAPKEVSNLDRQIDKLHKRIS